MLATVLFEVNLIVQRIIFPQPGFLKGFVDADQFYEYDTFFSRFVEELVFPDDRERVRRTFQITKQMNQKGRLHCEFRMRITEEMEYQWVCISEMISYDKKRAIGSIENIHIQKQKEQELKFQAEYDTLTGLMNRNTFHRIVNREMKKPEAVGMYTFLDVDDFKKINDTHGHGYGDWLLTKIGTALRSNLPDKTVIGRYGGDEFMVYIPGVGTKEEAAGYAQIILDAITGIETDEGSLSASVGVALYPRHGTSIDTGLTKCADIAMYQAKCKGKCCYSIYDPELSEIKKYSKSKSTRTNRTGLLNRGSDNQNQALVILVCGLLLTALFGGLTAVYTQRLDLLVNEESQTYLEEISTQMNSSLIKEMNSNYTKLESLAVKVEQLQDWSADRILSDLTRQSEIFNYKQLALIDREGRWVTQHDTQMIPDLSRYILKMEDTKAPVTTPIISLFDEDCVVFLYPLRDTVIDGINYTGIAAMADIEMLNSMLALNLFDGSGYSHVVTKHGNVVIRSNHNTNTFQSYNLFKYLERAVFKDHVTIDLLQKDFSAGESRKIQYEIDGRDLLSVYAPVGYSDWYLFTVIPNNILTERTSQFYKLTLLICAGIILLFLLLLVAIFLILMRGRKKLEEQLYTDAVTGGISKVKFELEAEAFLNSKSQCSIIYANIGKFKLVNERNGSNTGDQLLRGVYQIIEHGLDETELVSRLMADHYGIVVATKDLQFLHQRIINWNKRIQNLVEYLNIATSVSLDCGVLPVEEKTITVSLLLDKANLARKMASPGEIMTIYDENLAKQLRLEGELENRQEQALKDHEFVIYFQPKYNPRTNNIVGAEALVRWMTADLGMLMPGQFIPLFESNGFIAKLDLYVFEQTCGFIQELQKAGIAEFPVSVNLSRYSLNKPDFMREYVQVWSDYRIEASLLEFEITETLVFENRERLNDLLRTIHRHGFRVAMDDFGSGYSSLNMLKDVEIDVLKLDREFFNQNASSTRGLFIVGRLIELAKDLGIQVVAEGVESSDIVEFLIDYNCDLIQGYYYSPPVPESEMWNLLKG